MTNQHPIIPPPELVQSWYEDKTDYFIDMIRAAQWGSDQELDACCEWLQYDYPNIGANALRDARRPKPYSLKEQALADFDWLVGRTLGKPEFDERSERIRRALEQIDD